jgi:zinc protease
VRRVASAQWLGAMYHLPQGANADATASEALAEIMTVEPAGRLYKALVEGKKASSVENWFFPQHDAGFVIFWAQVPNGEAIDATRDTMLATLYDVAAHPITDAELDRVRKKAQKDFDDTINDPEKMSVALADAIAEGDWRLFFIRRDRWRTVTVADVTRVATQWLKSSNLTIGMFLPETKPDRAPMLASVDVPALVNNYKGDPAVAAGESFDPSPANLEARTERFALPNGMKVALLSKKTRGETAQIELRLDVGATETLRNSSPASAFTASMLERGTAKHDRQAFADALDKLRTKLDIGGGGATVAVNATTVRGSVPDVLRLAAEALREPAFVPAEFEQMKRERLTALEQSRSDPTAIARRAVARAGNPYPPDDVRYTPTIDEEIDRVRALDLAAVKAFHAKFYGASHAELAIVGDFDAATVKPLIRELFGDYASPTDVRDARQGQRGDVRPPVAAAQRRGGGLRGTRRRQSHPRRRQRLADLQARAREGRAVVFGWIGVPAGADRREQHVCRLRDLRAAKPREGSGRHRRRACARPRWRICRAGSRDGEEGVARGAAHRACAG